METVLINIEISYDNESEKEEFEQEIHNTPIFHSCNLKATYKENGQGIAVYSLITQQGEEKQFVIELEKLCRKYSNLYPRFSNSSN